MSKKKAKVFDCIEYKYKAQERIYNEIKNLNPDEEIEYFNRRIREDSFKDFVKSVTGKKKRENR